MSSSLALCLLSCLLLAALLSGCPANPDVDRRVQGAVRVPGLDEAVLARDKTIKTAIIMGWGVDPELMQEQLAVEEVNAGKVRITGIVSRPELKEKAEAIARDTEAVVDVISTITVDESLKDKRLDMNEI